MQTMKILCRKFEPFEKLVRQFYEQYATASGTDMRLELHSLPLPQLHDAIVQGDFDIAHVNTDWLSECWEKQRLEDMGTYIVQDPPEDYRNGWADAMLELQKFPDGIAGLPFHNGPECLIYRKDLFQDPVEKSNFFRRYGYELNPPKTWEEFADIANYFNRDGMYGTLFALYPDGHNNIFDFALQTWSRGGEFIDGNNRIVLDVPQAVCAMELYRELVRQDFVHKKSREFESIAACDAFVRGEAAMMVNWFGFAIMCDVDGQSALKGKIDVAPVPHSGLTDPVSLNVYYIWAIGKNSKIKEAAYQYIKNAVSVENDARLPLKGIVGCRRSTWTNETVNQAIPYYYKIEEIHSYAKTLPRIPQWNDLSHVIDNMVMRVVDTEEPVGEILKNAQQEVEKILAAG